MSAACDVDGKVAFTRANCFPLSSPIQWTASTHAEPAGWTFWPHRDPSSLIPEGAVYQPGWPVMQCRFTVYLTGDNRTVNMRVERVRMSDGFRTGYAQRRVIVNAVEITPYILTCPLNATVNGEPSCYHFEVEGVGAHLYRSELDLVCMNNTGTIDWKVTSAS